MIDALGFKGIWKRVDPEIVIATLRSLSEATETALDAIFKGDTEGRMKVATDGSNGFDLLRATFLSDTIVFAAAFKPLKWLVKALQIVPPGEITFGATIDRFAIGMGADVIGRALRAATDLEPVLAFRGAISFGDFEIDDAGRFLVGPAVDDAAEHHELAQGAFVWITPTALKVFLASAEPLPKSLLPYKVPLKGGVEFDTFVVNPFFDCKSEEQCTQIEDRLLISFSSTVLNVAIKRQHTAAFLKVAREAWKTPTPIPAMVLAP